MQTVQEIHRTDWFADQKLIAEREITAELTGGNTDTVEQLTDELLADGPVNEALVHALPLVIAHIYAERKDALLAELRKVCDIAVAELADQEANCALRLRASADDESDALASNWRF